MGGTGRAGQGREKRCERKRDEMGNGKWGMGGIIMNGRMSEWRGREHMGVMDLSSRGHCSHERNMGSGEAPLLLPLRMHMRIH